MKIGNYTDDEILEFMTEGEGRGFLGRSMFDAMYFEIERLNNDIKELLKENSNKEKVIIAQDNIIKEVREYAKNDDNFFIIDAYSQPIVDRIQEDILEILDNENRIC